MAEVNEISKKRKRLFVPAKHSLMGAFSRSKSQAHLHCNRPGQSPSDSDPDPFVKKQKNSSLAQDSIVGYNLSSVSVKDLRSRRVFSPSSTCGVIHNCLVHTENLGKSDAAGKGLLGSQEACESGDLKKLGTSSNEDFVQSTPPDAEILGTKLGFARNASGFSDQFSERTPSENLQRNDGSMEKSFNKEKNSITSSTKSVLKPCSQEKLFRTPGSFSYRRLLPYLLDICKDYSRSPMVGHCPKTEKGLEEKQLLASNGQETLAETTGCSLEGQKSGSVIELNAVSVESHTSQEYESSTTEVQKFKLLDSCEDQNLNCCKHDSSSTIEDSHFDKETIVGSSDKMSTDDIAKNNFDSHFNKETVVGEVSSDEMLTDDVAKSNVASPCDAQNLKVLDQTFSTVNDMFESNDHDEVTQNSNDDTKQTEGLPKASICHSFEAQRLTSANPALSELEGSRKCSLQLKVDNDDKVVEQVEGLRGKCMSMTPPDPDLSSKSETDDNRGNRVRCLSQGIDHAIEKSTNETFNRNNGQDSNQNQDSSPKNKLVPNSRLHLKLSKIPSSFSYRRLLPFLTDITNDHSYALLGASKNNQVLKVEKSSKGKLPTFEKDACMETLDGKSCPAEHYTGDDVIKPVAAATAMGDSSKLTLSPPKPVSDSPMILDSQQESLVKHAALDSNQRLETSPNNVVEPPVMSSSCLINSGLFPREESAKSMSYQLPLETEGDCKKPTVECTNHEKLTVADSFVEKRTVSVTSMPPEIPAAGLKKGILKINPRGCRGICTCLNCSSFRLHAERSFEFSRIQMQDAEEVALDLIKELSYLRLMLEKSAFGVKDHTTICINQVKEACKKASDAEELAKARLGEMNYNLNIHCRIPSVQRPSVRFANYVEEQIIPIADSSNK